MIISETAIRQWATYNEDCDELKGTYYVNCYFDEGEGFTRRDTVASELNKRTAIRLTNSINKTMAFFSPGV